MQYNHFNTGFILIYHSQPLHIIKIKKTIYILSIDPLYKSIKHVDKEEEDKEKRHIKKINLFYYGYC